MKYLNSCYPSPNKLLLAALVSLGMGSPAYAEDATLIHCGQAVVSVNNSHIQEAPFFFLKIRSADREVIHSYSAEGEFFEARCDSRADGKPLLLFNHLCGGTACVDSNYGIADPDSGEVLLEPGDRYNSNADRASQVLRHAVKPFSCPKFSKTSVGAEGTSGEFCFVSPLQLD